MKINYIKTLIRIVFLSLILIEKIIAQGTITVVAPNGGETWVIGTLQNIIWDKSGTTSSYVNIDYSTNSGSSWISIFTQVINDGNQNWTIPSTPSSNCRVRITDYNNSNIFDISNANFIIAVGAIKVTSPNGGENWTVGTTHPVLWTTEGNVGANVRISYKRSTTTIWTTIIASTPNNGTYNWTIPNNLTPGNNYKVKIEDATNSAKFDTSDAYFTISPVSITVIDPNGGEDWSVNSTRTIQWTSSGDVGTAVNIYYKRSATGTWYTIATNTPNDGSHEWVIPNYVSEFCKVRIVSYSNSAISDTSDNYFSITPPGNNYYTLTHPNGGEYFVGGSATYIYWTVTGYLGNVTLQYSTNSGLNWINIVQNIPNDIPYQWTIPNINSVSCRIKVLQYIDPTIFDMSDNDFTISSTVNPNPEVFITYPANGQTFASPNLRVEGTATDPAKYFGLRSVSLVQINLNSTGWVSAVTTTSWASWYKDVVLDLGSNVIQARATDDVGNLSLVKSVTVNYQPVSYYITVTQPNGGENWHGGTVRSVLWTDNIPENVRLELYKGGIFYSTIISSIASSGSYNWQIPTGQAYGNDYKIKISSVNNGNIADMSDNNFTLSPAPSTISVIAPPLGATWTVGGSQTVTWSSTNVTGNVNIKLSTDGGVTYPITLADNTANDGTESITVPNNPSTTCRVKVESVNNTSIFGINPGSFTIVSGIQYFQINGSVNYDNSSITALSEVKIKLKQNDIVVDSSISDVTGNYSFTNVINGSYVLTSSIIKEWGGVNSTDALLLRRHIAGLDTLSALRQLAGDVNASGTVTSTDALIIRRRVAGIDSTFASGDWLFENPSLNVAGQNVIQNIKGICFGDLNGSYDPTGTLNKEILINTSSNAELYLRKNESLNVPIKTMDPIKVSAITLVIRYPEESICIQSISSKLEGLVYNYNNGEIRIAWEDLKEVDFKAGENLITLNIKNSNKTIEEGLITFTIDSNSELADGEANIITGVRLDIPSLLINYPEEYQMFNCYPNPFNSHTTIEFFLPEDIETAQLIVFDALGQLVQTLVNGKLFKGQYKYNWDASGMATGIYFCYFKADKVVSTKKIILIK